MARTKAFDIDQALEAAIHVFREHGYAGSSATMLTEAMGIGRQSLYDTFGDKWQLYCQAVQRYGQSECEAHIKALTSGHKAIDGIHALMSRVVAQARQPCLGVYSIAEFGRSNPELTKQRERLGSLLNNALCQKIQAAQAEGDISSQWSSGQLAAFLMANIAGIRLTARAGASTEELNALEKIALQALG